jgi:hypothetical protein
MVGDTIKILPIYVEEGMVPQAIEEFSPRVQ